VLASCPRALADSVREATDELDHARALRLKAEGEGHAVARSGPAAMSARDFERLLKSVQTTRDELAKGDIVKNALGIVGLTTDQLGTLLDALGSDVVKLDLVTSVAHEVIDPEHGTSLATHFDNVELGHEAVAAVSRPAP
jgi:hypothetical protein